MCFESTSLTKDVKKGCLQINEKMNKEQNEWLIMYACATHILQTSLNSLWGKNFVYHLQV